VRPLLDVRDLTIEFPQSLAGRALSSAHPAGLGTTMTGAAAVRSLSSPSPRRSAGLGWRVGLGKIRTSLAIMGPAAAGGSRHG